MVGKLCVLKQYSSFPQVIAVCIDSQTLLFLWAWLLAPLFKCIQLGLHLANGSLKFTFLFSVEDSPGWDAGRTNCFVNGFHDNRMNGAGNFNRGPPRNDRTGRGSFRGTRGGGTFNQPMHNTSKSFYYSGINTFIIFLLFL